MSLPSLPIPFPLADWIWIFYPLGVVALLLLVPLAMILFGGERGVRAAGAMLARLVYRVRTHGLEHLPEGGFVLLPNHVSYVDAIILQLACPRPIRFLIVETIYNGRWLKPLFRKIGALPISAHRAKDAVRKASELVAAGEVVCVFPEGELTRTGSLLRLKKGFELIVRHSGAKAVPVWMDELWGSVFSYEGGRYFNKLPKRFPYPVTVAFGEPLPSDQATVANVREKLLELGEYCYNLRPILRGHLGEACVRGLKHRQFRNAVIDGMDESRLNAGMLLAASCALGRHLRKACPKERVAVVLPPGKGAMVANLAILLAGKIPANLNFTAGKAALEAAIRRGDLAHALTARKMQAKLGEFPWPEEILHLEKILPSIKPGILLWRILILLLPAALLVRMLGIPREGDRSEAVLLFTSGSSGEPKGVVLSHRNILGNVSQFGAMLSLGDDDRILASLPFFHSFGCTVTLWYPMIEGIESVTYPSPLETAKNAELIHKHKVTLLCSTPTFLRSYLRKVDPWQIRSVRLLITGAEKLPDELARRFEEKFGIPVLQGYGLTETSPVVSTNLPDPPVDQPGFTPQPSCRAGSVGKMAPGIAAQIRDPDTGEKLALSETGMLWLRGPNIFEGYLHQPEKTSEVIRDGWFMTGDIGRLDDDGFLYIEGRLSRFSKIGGEMVPHETVEAAIEDTGGIDQDEGRKIVVVGIPDEAKGEALIVLSSIDLDLPSLRPKLLDAGLPNLFIPKKVIKVENIPLLGSGKVDLKTCQQLARDA